MLAARAFGPPQCVFFRGNEAGSMPAAASRHGIVRLSAEIGGGRDTSGSLVERCREGLLGCLGELGLLPARPLALDAEVRLYDLDAPAATLRAREPGVFIPDVELGQPVAARQQIGRLIEPARPDTPARVLASPQAGTVVCLRAIARSGDGDCLFQIAPALPGFLPSRYWKNHADEPEIVRPALHPLRQPVAPPTTLKAAPAAWKPATPPRWNATTSPLGGPAMPPVLDPVTRWAKAPRPAWTRRRWRRRKAWAGCGSGESANPTGSHGDRMAAQLVSRPGWPAPRACGGAPAATRAYRWPLIARRRAWRPISPSPATARRCNATPCSASARGCARLRRQPQPLALYRRPVPQSRRVRRHQLPESPSARTPTA